MIKLSSTLTSQIRFVITFNEGFLVWKLIMSKRYSGKSFKDSSVKKKPKLSFKEKRRLKKDRQKKTN
jgi:hypothetical protein